MLATRTSAAVSSTKEERHIEVSLRMIGHQLLLSLGDSTSRVLPIERHGDSYRIRFAKEFAFNPDDLTSIIDSVVNATRLAYSYNVAFETCDTKETVHMYEVGATTNANVLACGSRDQPLRCYSLLFTILDAPPVVEADSGQSETLSGYASSEYRDVHRLLLLLMVVLIALAVAIAFLRKRRSSGNEATNGLKIGEYMFNPNTMELIFGNARTELTGKESELLQLLCTSANDTIDRETILRTVWGDDGDYVGRTLDVFISKLRKKLEADPNVKIANIRGVGYKLVIDV